MDPVDTRRPVIPIPAPFLHDAFVVLRPVAPEDAPAIAAACQDPLIQERCYFVPSPYTLQDAEAFVAASARSFADGAAVHCAIRDARTDELLGAINLNVFPEREAAETGYWVRRESRGRGVATAALRLMMRFAFETAGVERLELMTEVPNLPSQALARKLGFREEGVARGYLASRGERDRDLVDPAHGRIDQVVFALLRPEWEALAGSP